MIPFAAYTQVDLARFSHEGHLTVRPAALMEPLGELGWITEQYWRGSGERGRRRSWRRDFGHMGSCGVWFVSGEGVLKQGVDETDAEERAEQDIGDGGKPEVELVGAHGGAEKTTRDRGNGALDPARI